jgi:hypothetical protein
LSVLAHNKACPQDFMPAHDLLEAPFQPGNIQVAFEPPGEGHVVEGVAGLKAIQKPKLLLRVREREERRPDSGSFLRRMRRLLRGDLRRLGTGNTKALLFQQALQKFPFFFQDILFQHSSSGSHLPAAFLEMFCRFKLYDHKNRQFLCLLLDGLLFTFARKQAVGPASGQYGRSTSISCFVDIGPG